MKKAILGFSLAMISCSSFAVGVANGQVDLLLINSSNYLMFSAGAKTGAPGCNSVANQWAVSLDTAKGKSMYALLLQAQSQGKSVYVEGSGACTDWPDREFPVYMFAQ